MFYLLKNKKKFKDKTMCNFVCTLLKCEYMVFNMCFVVLYFHKIYIVVISFFVKVVAHTVTYVSSSHLTYVFNVLYIGSISCVYNIPHNIAV